MSTGQGQKVPPKKNWFFRKDSGALRKENAFYEQGREPSGKKMQFTNRVGSPPERKCNLRTGSEALRKENAFYEQIREPYGKKIQFTNKTRRKTNGPQTGRTGAEENGKKWLFRTEKNVHGKKL